MLLIILWIYFFLKTPFIIFCIVSLLTKHISIIGINWHTDWQSRTYHIMPRVVHLWQYCRRRGGMHATKLNVATQDGGQDFGLQGILSTMMLKHWNKKKKNRKIHFSSICQLWVNTDVRKMTSLSFLLSPLHHYHRPHSFSVTLDYIPSPVIVLPEDTLPVMLESISLLPTSAKIISLLSSTVFRSSGDQPTSHRSALRPLLSLKNVLSTCFHHYT